jgi:hypothetical protein
LAMSFTSFMCYCAVLEDSAAGQSEVPVRVSPSPPRARLEDGADDQD